MWKVCTGPRLGVTVYVDLVVPAEPKKAKCIAKELLAYAAGKGQLPPPAR